MISWAEYNDQQRHLQSKLDRRKNDEKDAYYSEMCDVCGSNSFNIRRKAYVSKSGMTYVIRYCEYCNPDYRWNFLNL